MQAWHSQCGTGDLRQVTLTGSASKPARLGEDLMIKDLNKRTKVRSTEKGIKKQYKEQEFVTKNTETIYIYQHFNISQICNSIDGIYIYTDIQMPKPKVEIIRNQIFRATVTEAREGR